MPEIRFTTGVQSFGREDISAPGREAAAKIGVKDAVVSGVLQVERAAAAAQYTKQMSDARNSISELYDTVVSSESFMSSEIPEYVTGFERYEEVTGPDGQIIIQERRIDASEIREQWFRQGMLNITNAAVKGSTAPTARQRVSQELRTSIGPAAYNQLLTYNRQAAKKERLAKLDSAIQTGVANGDRFGVEAVLERYRLIGDISRADYEVRQLEASQNLDIEAYSKSIEATNNMGDLEALEDSLGKNMSQTGLPGQSDMTAAQRNILRSSINAQRSALNAERKEMHTKFEQEGLALYTEGRLSSGWIRNRMRNDEMERGAGQALIGLLEGGRDAKAIDPLKVSGWQAEVQSRLMYTDFGTQTSDVATAMKRELQDSDLTGAERQKVYEYIDKVNKGLRENPDYNQALFSLRTATGMPEIDDVIMTNILKRTGQYGNILKITEDFSNALFQYIDEFGAEAKPYEFIQKNKQNYNLEDNAKAKQTRFEEAYPELIIPGPVGTQDPKVILHRLYNQYLTTGGSDVELEKIIAEVYTFWYGTSLDIGNL